MIVLYYHIKSGHLHFYQHPICSVDDIIDDIKSVFDSAVSNYIIASKLVDNTSKIIE
jgi:hypothetical protein